MKVVDLIKSARDREAWGTIVGQSAVVPPRRGVNSILTIGRVSETFALRKMRYIT